MSQQDNTNQEVDNTNNANKPDHGQNFLPGAEHAPDLAPQPLDHFKRGYQERASLRDREWFQDGRQQQHARHMDAPSDKYHHRPAAGGAGGRRGDSSYSSVRHVEVGRLVDRITRPGCNLADEMSYAFDNVFTESERSKSITAILSNLARRRKIGIAFDVWHWMDTAGLEKNVYHYNSLISVFEKTKDSQKALGLLREMDRAGVQKNEVTFSSAISACEKCGQWRDALNLLDQMKREGVGRTAIAYNAAISACEKGLVPNKALEIFETMKKEGITPTVITFSALISACEKGQQWKLALEVLEEMKAAGHGANVIAYSACISALSKGQQWEKALDLFRDIERSGGTPSVVTYNATMTALEKGLQWERALDLFDEMKNRKLAVTVVSYGSAIAACEKGFQWRQCLEYLDEMTEVGIKKNVIIFGAAMSCMEKCGRADIAFQLMDRMRIEGVTPNVHIYNSAISACARCGLWEQGYDLFKEMDRVGVVPDVVSYNAVLEAVACEAELARNLFKQGVDRGFYARVSRLGGQWLELDLHFLSLGGGETGLIWWFEECLVPYLVNSTKLEAIKSIDIVTGYGKTRMRGIRHGDDGMRKRVRAMLKYMNIKEIDQPNKGRVHIDKQSIIDEVKKNNGKIVFDKVGYAKYKEDETTATEMPEVEQKVRPKITPIADTRSLERGRNGHNRVRNDFRGDRRNSGGFEREQGAPGGYNRNWDRNNHQGGAYDRRDSQQGGGFDRNRDREPYPNQGGGYDHNRDRRDPQQFRSEPPRPPHEARPVDNTYGNQSHHSSSEPPRGSFDDQRGHRTHPREPDHFQSQEPPKRFKSHDGGFQRDDRRYDNRRDQGGGDGGSYHRGNHNYDNRREHGFDGAGHPHRDNDRDFRRPHDEGPSRYGEDRARPMDSRAFQDRSHAAHGGDYHNGRPPAEGPGFNRPHGDFPQQGGGHADYHNNPNSEGGGRNPNAGGYHPSYSGEQQYGNDHRRPSGGGGSGGYPQGQDRDHNMSSFDSNGPSEFERQPKRGYDLDAVTRRAP